MTEVLTILAVPLFLTYIIAGITVFADIIYDFGSKS
jgi:hypothetical protein